MAVAVGLVACAPRLREGSLPEGGAWGIRLEVDGDKIRPEAEEISDIGSRAQGRRPI